MNSWFNNKQILENINEKPISKSEIEYNLEQKIIDMGNINDKIDDLQKQINNMESKLDSLLEDTKCLIESNKLLISWYKSIIERDQRNLNYSIRGFAKGKNPPIPFVADKSKSDF